MRIALLADLHANVLALEAVQTQLARFSPDLTIVLGDLVGYGANPKEVIELVRASRAIVIAGNHDVDALKEVALPGTHQAARSAQTWTRSRLSPDEIEYLKSLPNIVVRDEGLVGVHGCYMNDSYYKGYVTGSMVEHNLRKVAESSEFPTIACCGHTHISLFAYLHRNEVHEPKMAEEHTWPVGCASVLINPGSVGQPRDGHKAASFAIVDLDVRQVQFVRVPYDVEAAAARIVEAGLPPENGSRLLEGR